MASRIAKTPLVQLQRHLAAQAAPAAAVKKPADGIETSTLPNGLIVSSVSAPASAVTTLGVVVKAGSRFESHDNLGVGHAIRIAAGLATKNSTSFAVVRNLQQVGAGLTCTQGREYLLYTTQMTRDKVDTAIDFFLDTIAQPVFKPWELSDNAYRMVQDVAELSNEAKAVELVHKAAYRTGLGNSIISPAHMIGKHKAAMLEAFHAKHFVGNGAALVGVGIDHAKLLKYADILKLNKGAGAASAGKYYGGEVRQDCGGRQAVVVLAADTAGLSNPREAVACRLLQKILGAAPKIPFGNGVGQLHKAATKACPDANFAVSAVNYDYVDSGLVGAFIVSEAAAAGKVVEAVAAALRSASVTEAELKAAKKALAVDISESNINALDLAVDIGVSGIIRSGHPLSSIDKLDLIAQASLADVQAVAKKLASSKLSMSAVGNLVTVPYLDAL